MPPLTEADTKAKLIDPSLHARGWTEDLIRREETAGAVEIVAGRPRRQGKGRVDYPLRIKTSLEAQPVAVALLEAKAERLPPGHGLEQGKCYAACRRLNAPFVFSSNGHLFVEFDRFTGLTSTPRPLTAFPSTGELRSRYERGMGFSLASPLASPLITRYRGGEEGTRRYYQDAALRAVLERIARGEKRALLLKRIAHAGQLRRALFICDRDELRTQGLGTFQNVFGSDAASVSGSNPQKNARILIATYPLDVDTEEADANFLTRHYPENYISHIVIDECQTGQPRGAENARTFRAALWESSSASSTASSCRTSADSRTTPARATQVLFLQHVIDSLTPGGRCGIVLDEGVLFRTNETAFVQTKRKLLDDCDVQCVVSLPGGVFTAAGAGVKTNRIFFTKGKPTETVWSYDLSDVKVGKSRPFMLDKFDEFFELWPKRADSKRSWTVARKHIEAKNFDLKAVNPNAKLNEDMPTPDELLDLIEAKGGEVAGAIGELRKLTQPSE